MSKKIDVFPGDEVAVEEEYMASDGTFAQDGKVYAAQFGQLVLDEEEYTAKVITPNPPNVLKVGDIVYATIAGIRNTMATVDVVATDHSKRQVGGETYGTIHVSKISPDYTDDVSNEFRVGDLVRARVIDVSPSLQLTTKDPHLGVVKSLCGTCKTEFKKSGKNKLRCEKCNYSLPRKLADDYGDVVY